MDRRTGIDNGAGRWMREIEPDQDRFWFDTYGRVALTGEPVRFENYFTPLAHRWDIYAFRISGPRRIAVLYRDITDQKLAEARLRALNADLERRVTERAHARGRTRQLSPEIMGVINADGFFEQSNSAWRSVLGWSETELASVPLLDFVLPDDLAKVRGKAIPQRILERQSSDRP